MFRLKTTQQLFYVCHKVIQGLFGKPAISSLNLLQTNCSKTTQDFTKQYSKDFNNLVKINGKPIHIKLKENTTLYQLSSLRYVVLFLLQPVKEKLGRMLGLGVTVPCQPIIIAQKENGTIQSDIDIRWSTARILPVGKCR